MLWPSLDRGGMVKPRSKEKPVVIISSTARDLPEYRRQAMEACLRLDMFPKMMEHLPALDADAINASLDLVDEADVYIGLFAQRYGYVPEGYELSITHMEYERAVERGIPRLIFLMDDVVPVSVADIDFGNRAKLNALKAQIKKERVVSFFRDPHDFRGHLIHSLGEIKKRMETGKLDEPISENTSQASRLSVVPCSHCNSKDNGPEPGICHRNFTGNNTMNDAACAPCMNATGRGFIGQMANTLRTPCSYCDGTGYRRL